MPIFAIFILFTYKFYKQLMRHHVERLDGKLTDLQMYMGDFEANPNQSRAVHKSLIGAGMQSVSIIWLFFFFYFFFTSTFRIVLYVVAASLLRMLPQDYSSPVHFHPCSLYLYLRTPIFCDRLITYTGVFRVLSVLSIYAVSWAKIDIFERNYDFMLYPIIINAQEWRGSRISDGKLLRSKL